MKTPPKEVKKTYNTIPHDLAILAEQTSQIYAAVNKSLIATFINSIILTFVLWTVIDHNILLIWLFSILLVSLLRFYTAYRFKKTSPSPDEIDIWNQLFLIGSITASVIWGASSIWLFPEDDLARQVFLAFVVGGMAAGAIVGLSFIKLAIYSFLALTSIPLILRIYFSDTELSIEMGTMISLYYFVLFQSAKQTHIKIVENISMRIENLEQEKALNKNERRYKVLLETASDAFFLYDLDGNFLDVNNQACQSLGYTRDELLSMSVLDIGEANDKESPDLTWKNLKDGDKIQVEGVHIRKDGSSFPVEVNLGVIHVGDETLLSVLARDITERKRIDRMKNEFISTVSHEIRTPLTSIKGSLGLITGGAVGEVSTQVQEMLKVAGNNTERLLFLINDILDIQKIESGEFEMEMDEMELIPFINQSIQDNSSYAKQYDVKISLDDSFNKNIKIYANKARLMQVMANLLSNAAKFSYANGNVEVSISENKDNTVRISIIDHGEGITEEFQSRMFDKFTQQDSSDSRNKGGTGLGLNISKAIVEKHGGKFGFTSILNKGSTFYFDLPKLK